MRLMLDTCVIIDLLTDVESLNKGALDLIDDTEVRTHGSHVKRYQIPLLS